MKKTQEDYFEELRKLGWTVSIIEYDNDIDQYDKVVCCNYIVADEDGDRDMVSRIVISLVHKHYCCYDYFDMGDYISYEVHKILSGLFEVWGWDSEQ